MKNTATTNPITQATPDFIQAIADRLASRGRPKIPAQGFFQFVAREAGYEVNALNHNAVCTAVKPLIESLVLQEVVKFRYVEGGTSFYTVTAVPSNGTGVKPAYQGEFRKNWRTKKGGLHEEAGKLMAQTVFFPDLAFLSEAKAQLEAGSVYHDDCWCTRKEYKPSDDEEQTFEEVSKAQMYQVASISALAEQFPRGFSFDVFCDDRGRFYYAGGYASPHCGKLNRRIYTHTDSMVCLDHRTSFAQNFALVTGSTIGRHCGVGVSDECDFWVGVLSQYGVTIKHGSPERAIAKAYGMPTFYGAGKARATESADKVARTFITTGKLSEPRYNELLSALEKVGEDLRDFGERTRAFAQSWVDIGEMPRWNIPTGFTACKEYYTHVTREWNSGSNETWAYPRSMTTRIETKRICEKSNAERGDKSVLVATCANILQSLDSSVLAGAIVRFHKLTGYAPYVIHDSYTVNKEDEKTLIKCVIESMRAVADSDEVAELRRDLSLPPVKAVFGNRKPDPKKRNLFMIDMNPLDRE